MADYLGVEPPDHALGMLQDMHWAVGAIGYFATYALGNVISGQLWEKVDGRDPRPARPVRAGRVRRARRLAPARTSGATAASSRRARLVERITGGGLDSEPYLRYLRGKYPLGDLDSPRQSTLRRETSMAIRVGINGFGRIGRNFFRAQLERGGGHRDRRRERPRRPGDDGPPAQVRLGPGAVRGRRRAARRRDSRGGEEIKLLSERDPGAIPWGDLGVDVVLESTGFFTKRDGAQKHLDAGAKKVVISAPATDPDVTIVLGVNDDAYDKDAHHIVSNASCTTNCIAPMAKVLHDTFAIEHGFMTTIHAYTNDQNILDLPHRTCGEPARPRST